MLVLGEYEVGGVFSKVEGVVFVCMCSFFGKGFLGIYGSICYRESVYRGR